MKERLFSKITIAFLIFLAYPCTTDAIVIGFHQDFLEIEVGNPLNVDIVALNLGNFTPPSLGAFDIEIAFDCTILSFGSATFGSFLGDPSMGEAIFDYQEITPGLVNLYDLSLLSSIELDALQPADFSLATLHFNTISLGNSTINLTVKALSDATGGPFLFNKEETTNVNVTPEPTTILLVGSGLISLAGFRRKFIKS